MTEKWDQNHTLLAELTECENHVWDALVDGDRHADEAALGERFLGVYPDGFAGKTQHVQQLSNGSTMHSYTLSDIRVLTLGTDHAVLSYRAEFCRRNQNKLEGMYVSSIWERVDGGWINIFSQDTPSEN